MESLDNLLIKAGLSKSERMVYESGLSEPHKTVDFLKELKMPRSTITAAIDALEDFGLCSALPIDKKTFVYTMLPPEHLNTFLSQKASDLSNLMDKLSSYKAPKNELHTIEVEGQEAVQGLLELALHCKNRKWHIIATKQNPIKYMPDSYTKYFKKVRNERQIESLSLWDDTGRRDLGLHELLMRKPRYIPKNITKKIPGLLLSFDDSLLLIEGESNPRAVLIENSSITETYRIIFEMAWRLVKPA